MFLLCLQHFTSDFQVVSAMRFFKNASRTEVVQGRKNKSHAQSWKGAHPKNDPLTVKKKVEVVSKNGKIFDFRSNST